MNEILTVAVKENRFDIKPVGRSIIKNLKGVKVLWILFPMIEFTEIEVENIVKFVNRGGGLLLSGEEGNAYRNAEILNEISEKFGITFNKDKVTDLFPAPSTVTLTNEDAFTALKQSQKLPGFIKISKFGRHPITSNIDEIAYFAGCSLKADEKLVIAKSKLYSFSDIDHDGKWGLTEQMGPLNVLCATEIGKGRVVCIGDTSLFTDKYIGYADNKQLCMNILKWLSKII